MFGVVADAADKAVVDKIRNGDEITSITIKGDAEPLLAKEKAHIDQWNAVLDHAK